jgi:hypothetical protein
MLIRQCLALLLLVSSLSMPTFGQAGHYAAIEADAERLFAERSYGLAHQAYVRLAALPPPEGKRRWVAFRLADTHWRSAAATEQVDSTIIDQARTALNVLVRDIQRVEDRDLVWAEVMESLGDSYWARRDGNDWGSAWSHYQQALDWWAGARDVETARTRFINIVHKMSAPRWGYEWYPFGYYCTYVPFELLENFLTIARRPDDVAMAHYLLALAIRQQGGNWERRHRVPEEFEAALEGGKSTEWYDDALYHYAEWMEGVGRAIPLEDGSWRQEPDFAKALHLYRRLTTEFRKGETRYYDQAIQRINGITQVDVGISVPHVYIPGSEIELAVTWRNTPRVDVALYAVDLTRDLLIAEDVTGPWYAQVNLAGRQPVRSWVRQTNDPGGHVPGQEMVRLDSRLASGAYVVEAVAGSKRARDLVLVTDTSLVIKTAPGAALVYYGNADDGAPVAGARVRVWRRSYVSGNYLWRDIHGITDKDGIAKFEMPKAEYNDQLYAVAALLDRQAFCGGYATSVQTVAAGWRVYAFTDRPAYRPGETVQWKLFARQYAGSQYTTPAGQTLGYEVVDARGAKIAEGQASLNAFGSAAGSLHVNESMLLGEYRVRFRDSHGSVIGSATLFRLEEYKLPEFKVSVSTPVENGQRKAYRLGEKVEVVIQADYYFGGPVNDANVELVIYQSPYYRYWYKPREFPWYYEDMQPRYYGHGDGQVLRRETLKTDATGKATLSFQTQRSGQDMQFRIEARVTDASRREIVASESLRIGRQRYGANILPKHMLVRPHDQVSATVKVADLMDQPVQTRGTVKVTRDYWWEVWVDPAGRKVSGVELQRLQDGRVFPPPPRGPERPWRLEFRGYQHEEILTQTLDASAQGEATVAFTPERDGYYSISWSSPDPGGPPVTAQTSVWVATNATTELGYRTGGLQIVVDDDTARAGGSMPVMLVAPSSNRHVLLVVEGDGFIQHQLVRMNGTAKLLQMSVDDRYIPNVFVEASMIADRQLFTDMKQVIVPPVKSFLTVDVKADREVYQPREAATLTVTTRDDGGRPVAAEVALGLVDESVYYIQQDYAGDPRQFYYGQKRAYRLRSDSTFQQKQYKKLVAVQGGVLLDQSEVDDMERRLAGAKDESGARSDPFYRSDRSKRDGRAHADKVAEAPAPPPAASSESIVREEKQNRRQLAGELDANARNEAVGGAGEPAVVVRSDFRATVFWGPEIVTGADGTATVSVTYPDSLTSWKATARAATAGSRFGAGETSTRTRQPLIVRLHAPRFFVVGDKATVSAVINNNTDGPLSVATTLELEGLGLQSAGAREPVTVPGNGEARVDWQVAVTSVGTVKARVSARGGSYRDAMELSYPVYEHGIDKLLAKSGKMRGDEIAITLDIPAARRKESTTLDVQVAPSMAVTMLDALPYLADYPYGCTEQTMSRFLPAAITAKTLRDLGMPAEAVEQKLFGGIEPEHAAATHPGGRKDLRRLSDMTNKGLSRLYDFQHSDGGWGWWKEGESDHFMTAYVVWGMTLARDAGIEIRPAVLDRAVDFLDKELVEEERNVDVQAWMLHALSVARAHRPADEFRIKALDNLLANRERLNAYTRALLALAAHNYGRSADAMMLVRNLANGVKLDRTPDASVIEKGLQKSRGAVVATAHWGEVGVWWRWSDGSVEATSFVLRALVTIDPQNQLIEPVTNWLVKNRRGAQWSNTRDTAIAVLALTDYLRKSGELSGDIGYELLVNGRSIATKQLNAADALSAPTRYAVPREMIRDGGNEIRIVRRNGTGPLYFAAEARFFSLEEPIAPVGNEIFVSRQYFKLVGRPTLLKGYVYDRVPLLDGQTVKSGERIEVVLTIESKNDYEYLVFEDLKPAGFEAVEVRSGSPLYARELKSGTVARGGDVREASDYTGRSRWTHQELRDRKVAMFVDKLAQGVWELRYDLRAEVPGEFHALPVLGHAMYVPEIRCNGQEVRVRVVDDPE